MLKILLHSFFIHCMAQKTNHLKGYECIKILIAILLNILKGLMMYKEGVALKRKIVFPLFRTINVCGEREGETDFQNKWYDMVGTRILCKPLCYQRSPLSHGVRKWECSLWLLFLTFSNPASGGSTVTESYNVLHFLKHTMKTVSEKRIISGRRTRWEPGAQLTALP